MSRYKDDARLAARCKQGGQLSGEYLYHVRQNLLDLCNAFQGAAHNTESFGDFNMNRLPYFCIGVDSDQSHNQELVLPAQDKTCSQLSDMFCLQACLRVRRPARPYLARSAAWECCACCDVDVDEYIKPSASGILLKSNSWAFVSKLVGAPGFVCALLILKYTTFA